VNDEAIYAFSPVPGGGSTAPAPRPAPARRRWWPWVLGAFVLLTLLLAISGTVTLLSLLDPAREGVHLTVDGEDFGFFDGVGGVLALLGVAAGLMVALLCVLLVVPLTLLLVLLGVALAVAGVLLAALLVVGLALSPLWLVVLLLWLLLRRPAPKVAA